MYLHQVCLQPVTGTGQSQWDACLSKEEEFPCSFFMFGGCQAGADVSYPHSQACDQPLGSSACGVLECPEPLRGSPTSLPIEWVQNAEGECCGTHWDKGKLNQLSYSLITSFVRYFSAVPPLYYFHMIFTYLNMFFPFLWKISITLLCSLFFSSTIGRLTFPVFSLVKFLWPDCSAACLCLSLEGGGVDSDYDVIVCKLYKHEIID